MLHMDSSSDYPHVISLSKPPDAEVRGVIN